MWRAISSFVSIAVWSSAQGCGISRPLFVLQCGLQLRAVWDISSFLCIAVWSSAQGRGISRPILPVITLRYPSTLLIHSAATYYCWTDATIWELPRPRSRKCIGSRCVNQRRCMINWFSGISFTGLKHNKIYLRQSYHEILNCRIFTDSGYTRPRLTGNHRRTRYLLLQH